MHPRTIKVTVEKNVTRDQLVESLDVILRRFGCPACGLMGHGVVFEGDPDSLLTEVRNDLSHEGSGILAVSAQ